MQGLDGQSSWLRADHEGVRLETIQPPLSTRPGPRQRSTYSRVPRHVGFIPDGNRRWAEQRGEARREGYAAGILPGLGLLDACRQHGIREVSIYGFTRDNVRRPSDQVQSFRQACTDFAFQAIRHGAALLAVGDAQSPVFPDGLRPFAERRTSGDLRVNLLVNYAWQWDLAEGIDQARTRDIPRIDLVVRWGGRSRLSGFLPMQCAYADIHVIETLWPDMQPQQFLQALEWYQTQDVTLGG
jgi:undecaprenyl diphosphate synthase